MNKRQAKKKRKKEEQQRAMADFYVAIAELPAIVREIAKALREALDRLSKRLSEINVEEACQIQEQEKDKNLCDSCTTKECIFQSGIVRRHCDFYKEQRQGEQDGTQN